MLNENFVCIKVDREERPDVDRIYMTYVQATTGGGGWPMSVWLTPDLKPFVGGTYFPPDDRYGRPGFAPHAAAHRARPGSEDRDEDRRIQPQCARAVAEGDAGRAGRSGVRFQRSARQRLLRLPPHASIRARRLRRRA